MPEAGPTPPLRRTLRARLAAAVPPSQRQFLRFVVAAGLSVPVNLGTRVMCSRVMPYEFAIVASHLCGMVTAYLLTRVFVFERSGRRSHRELGRFTLVNVASVAQTWVVSVTLLRLVFPWAGFHTQPELVAHAAGLMVTAVSSFYGHRHYTFRKVSGA